MHCALLRTNADDQKVSDGGQCYSSGKPLEHYKYRTFSEISEASSVDWRNSDQRCSILTFLTLESDGNWRIVALPMRYDHRNLLGPRDAVNMDSLHLASSPTINAFRAVRPKAQQVPHTGFSHSIKPYASGSLPRSGLRYQFRNKASANKVARSNKFSDYPSGQSSVIFNNSSHSSQEGHDASNSTDVSIDSKVDKGVKKHSKKKTRKKGKQNKIVLSDSGSVEPEVLSAYAHGSSITETCGYNENGEEQVSHVSSPEISVSDCSLGQIHFKGDIEGYNFTEVQKQCRSNIDEGDAAETTIHSMVQNFPEELSAIKSEFEIQDREEKVSNLGGVLETNHVQMSYYDDMHDGGSSSMPDSLVLDSDSVDSESDDVTNAIHDLDPLDKESRGVSYSEASTFGGRKGCSSQKNGLNGAVDRHGHTEVIKRNSRNICNSDEQLPGPSRRGKQIKTYPRNTSSNKFGSVGNLHGRIRNENNHSVWQKVKRNGAEECNIELKKIPTCSQFDMTFKEDSLRKRNCNVTKINTSLTIEDKTHPKAKVSKKLKRKKSKQECDSSNGRGSNPIKGSSNACTKTSSHHNETTDISAQVNDKKGVKCVSKSHSHNNCRRTSLQATRIECENAATVPSLQAFQNASEPLASTRDVVSSAKSHHRDNQDNSLPKSCDSLDPILLQVQPSLLPHLSGDKVSQLEKEITLAEDSKQNHNFGSILQKWIPIGVKDSMFTTSSRFESSSLDHSDEPTAEDLNLRNIRDEKVTSDSQDLVSLLTLGLGRSSGNVNCFSLEDDCLLKSRNPASFLLKRTAADNLTCESKDQQCSAFEVESSKIEQAVNDACQIQLASEAVQIANGGPIAEFERLLHFSSPVICQSSCSLCFRTSLLDQVNGESICRHETSNMSLGCLWQWYEKHGSYGLEVRAEDYENSRRLGVDRFSFRAYFVPFLSAVQLFKNYNGQSLANNNEIPALGTCATCENVKNLENSSVGRLPIFSVLFPQPRTIGGAPSVDMTQANDVELLFEYFESEQPQQRRPLYEKIQELVRGDGPSHGNMYGDPTNLVSTNLHDLHPRSWYSVAWYPIYRIPDGNLRTAFLTYHSLGHLVRRSAKFDPPCMDACVVSPVVGLQSYNAQGECWFQLRRNAVSQTAGATSLNPSTVLKERLRTLEETAALMARAVVNKGNQTFVNRHPDYEFFLSRRSY